MARERAKAQLDDARAQLAIAKADRLPTVSLDANVGQALTDGSRLFGEYRTTGQVGVNVSMPIYQGGAAGARQRGVGYETVTIPGVKFLNRSFAACPSGGSKT